MSLSGSKKINGKIQKWVKKSEVTPDFKNLDVISVSTGSVLPNYLNFPSESMFLSVKVKIIELVSRSNDFFYP